MYDSDDPRFLAAAAEYEQRAWESAEAAVQGALDKLSKMTDAVERCKADHAEAVTNALTARERAAAATALAANPPRDVKVYAEAAEVRAEVG